MNLLEFCEWLRDTPTSIAIRESILLFPVLEGTHLLGIGMSAGAIAISDLRMMGKIFRKQPLSEVFNGIAPWMTAGFALMFVTGILLAWSEPMRCYESPWFLWKMIFLVLGGINAGVYHLTIWRSRAVWDALPDPPRQTYMAGLFSLIIWSVVIITGRTMAYSF